MNQKVLFLVLTIFYSVTICSAQVLQFGLCAEVETMKYFDLEKFLGKWYEIERFPTWYENYGHCAYKSIQRCGKTIEIEHGFIKDGIQYILHVNSTYEPGDDAVFVIQESNLDPVGIPLTVINTDYSTYAIVYGCKFGGLMGIKYRSMRLRTDAVSSFVPVTINVVSGWILSREKTISPEIKEKAYNELNSLPYVSTAYLEPVPQSEETCTYHWTAHVQASYTEMSEE